MKIIRSLALAIVVASLAACSGVATQAAPVHVPVKSRYVGIAAVSASALPGFEASTGIRPDLAEFYTTFGDPLRTERLTATARLGVLPLIQMNPYNVSLAAIAAGRFDNYLRSYAAGIKRTGDRVAISFAAEANGSWYTWGCNRTSAAVYVAAWRHIHDVMTQASGDRIIWVWDVNREFPSDCPLAARWPGAGYVTWVGMDGYWRTPGDNYTTAMAPTFVAIRGSTDKPVLIAEAGAPTGPAPGWIRSLFTGAEETPGVIGVVWFEYHSVNGDYRLQDDPPALAMFRREARNYR
jgi:mannan endo-1,4-beta-mannosidase